MRISPVAAAYIRKRATALMNDACIVYNPDDPVLDDTTGTVTTPYTEAKYEGPCRYWEVPAGQVMRVGEENIVLAQSYLSLPWDAPIPESSDTIEITQSEDPSLIGTTVTVVSTVRGGELRGSRRMLVRVTESEKGTW